ncbi:MAG: hypothetical protein AAF363_15795 [Bacteroidota bacterium]
MSAIAAVKYRDMNGLFSAGGFFGSGGTVDNFFKSDFGQKATNLGVDALGNKINNNRNPNFPQFPSQANQQFFNSSPRVDLNRTLKIVGVGLLGIGVIGGTIYFINKSSQKK